MNVYAPKSITERATFWERIRLQVADEEWCIVGDFDMIKTLHDSSNNNPMVLQGREHKQWEKICVHLNLRDIWHSDNFQRKRDSLYSLDQTGGLVDPPYLALIAFMWARL